MRGPRDRDAGCEVVRAVEDHVRILHEGLELHSVREFGHGDDAAMGIEPLDRDGGALGLVDVDRRRRVKDLAREVRDRHRVGVDHRDRARACSGEVEDGGRAKAPCSDHKKVRAADGGLPFLSELAQNHLAAHALPEVSGKDVPAGFVLNILHDFCDSVRLMRLIRRREPWRDNVRRCRGRSRRCFCLRFRGASRVPSRHGGRRRPICR